MLISTVSFGRKIPITKCTVKDLSQNKNTEATLVEFDCKDLSDIEEFMNIKGNWTYKEDIISNMIGVYRTKDFKTSSTRFFAIENDKNEIIGYSQIKKQKPDIILNLLESERGGKYKYVGQNLINFLCSVALEENYDRIYIPVPTDSASDFYLKKCGFKRLYHDCAMAMGKFRMHLFQKKTKKIKTHQ